MSGRIAAWAGLVVVYLLVLESTAPLDVLAGAVVAALVLRVLRPALAREVPATPGPPALRRALALPRYTASVGRDVVVGTAEVARAILGRPEPDHAGVVVIPLEDDSHAGAVLHGLMTTLSPGELLLGVDWERRELVLHVLDASDPDAVRARHARTRELRRGVLP